MCDKSELYQAAVELLDLMEEEVLREEYSLSLNDAWETFAEYVDELAVELLDE